MKKFYLKSQYYKIKVNVKKMKPIKFKFCLNCVIPNSFVNTNFEGLIFRLNLI